MKKLLLGILILGLFANVIFADSVGWRTDGTGRYPTATPPIEWSLEKNIVWSTPMPGKGNATPIIVGDKLFVCSEPDKLLCINLDDGKILWQKENSMVNVLSGDEQQAIKLAVVEMAKINKKLRPLAKELKNLSRKLKRDQGNEELKNNVQKLKVQVDPLKNKLKQYQKYSTPKTHKSNGYSTPTPVTDGKHVYALFGTSVVVCYDLDGNKQWGRIIEKARNGWGHSSSPVLSNGKLILHIINVIALDATSGETIWTAPSSARWGSPVLTKIGGEEVVITANGEIIKVDDGKVLKTKLSSLSYCAPLVHEDIVYFIQNGGVAIKLSGKADDSFKADVLWKTQPKSDRYYGSPVYHDGLLYTITRGSTFSVIDAKDGNIVYSKKMDFVKGNVYPSPTGAGGNIYISQDDGTTIVLKPGREYVEIAKNKLSPFRSCPVFHKDRMYVRAMKKMYCVGTK